MGKRASETEPLPKEHLGEPEVLVRELKDDGIFPNNKLPLLLYRKAVVLPKNDPATTFEKFFSANGWHGTWRNGIYSYHHYHSTAHEVLGIYCGTAKVELGGGDGVVHEVHPGDVIIIPAGVAHKNLGSSADFGVVGAYPHGQDWDMNYGKIGERPQADRHIARVALPKADPIYGLGGPLMEQWTLS
jgi:uncharacterized protein YjlB